MSDAHWDLLKKAVAELWPLVTLLIGIFVGGYISNRNQRKYWKLDNKWAEFRKLLTTLAECATRFVTIYGIGPMALSPKEQRSIARAAERSGNVIYNRLFIADEMKRLNVMNRWTQTMETLRKDRNMDAFTKGLDSVMEDIRAAALKDFS
jgi:hypothetical protein